MRTAVVKREEENDDHDLSRDFNSQLAHGLSLFNSGHFFDAHEALEDVWRPLPADAPVRRHLQGLVQLAVAFHHHSTGNYVGALSVLERATRNLDGADGSLPQLELQTLLAELASWQPFLVHCVSTAKNDATKAHPPAKHARGQSPPLLPKINLRHT